MAVFMTSIFTSIAVHSGIGTLLSSSPALRSGLTRAYIDSLISFLLNT